jgi:NADPH:quinone reductase-like Zn-dependent oxidoreductase
VRAVVVDAFGEDARPRLADVPIREPGYRQVRLRMKYASVNPADWKCQRGWMLPFPQFRPSRPFVLGFDGVGVVDAVGAAVRQLHVGQRLFVRVNQMIGQHGTFAETVCADVSDTAPVPDLVPSPPAATVPVAGVTAWQAVMKYAALRPGQRVLVNGGAGGVGSYAVQFARRAGALVAATCGPGNLDYMRSLGVQCAIDYRNQDVRAEVARWAPHGLDMLLDTVNTDGVPGASGMLKAGGVVIGVLTLGTKIPYADGELAARYISATVKREEASADMSAIGGLLARGAIRPPHLEVFRLDEAADLLDRVRGGHVRGKVVLAIEPDEA